MSVVGMFELLAWVLSAIIGGWLLLDVIRVSRRYGYDSLVNGEDLTDSTLDATTSVDDLKGTSA